MKKRKFSWIKFIIGVILFSFLHQLHDIFPNALTAIIAEGENEAVLAHMKMLFYTYILLTIGDYFLYYRKGILTESFYYARLLILASVPWMMISFFYVPESLDINLVSPYNMIFSIFASWVGIYTAISFEETLEAAKYSVNIKVLLVIFFISAIIIYTGFSFNPPSPTHEFF